MTGSQNPQLEKFFGLRSLTVPLESGMALRVRKIDELALLDGTDDAPNPLMAIVQQSMKSEAKSVSLSEVMQDPAAVGALRDTLNKMMHRVVLAVILPDGEEITAPFASGLTPDDFSIEEKAMVFMTLMGGEERLAAAQSFLQEQTSPVVAAPDGEDVRPAPVGDAGIGE